MKLRTLALPLLALVVSGCSSLGPYSILSRTPENTSSNLLIGVTANYPPMVYKQKGRIKGLEADFARKLAGELELEPVFVPMDWEDLLPSLEDGTLDIVMAGLSITTAREQMAAFCIPYLRVGQLATTRIDKAREYRVPESLIFTRDNVGVEAGTTGDLFVRKRCIQAERVTFKSAKKAVKPLLKGDIDIFIHDAPIIWAIAAENETNGLIVLPWKLTDEYMAWAVQRDNKELQTKANDILLRWRADGTLNDLISRWIPQTSRRRPNR